MRRRTLLGCSALLLACAQTTTVEHRAVEQTRAPEYFSISSIDVQYAHDLSRAAQSLAVRFRPGERMAENIRRWAKETGMWGGVQSIALRVDSLRLRFRYDQTSWHPNSVSPPNPLSMLEESWSDDHLAVQLEIKQGDRVLHHAQIERLVPGGSNRSFAAALSSDLAIDDLAADVAWQVVYEMTPPGYDDAIIQIGKREEVQRAWQIAARRGMITYDERRGMKYWSLMRGADRYDIRCGYLLSKPPWVQLWMWKAWTFTPWLLSYSECQERAAEAVRNR